MCGEGTTVYKVSFVTRSGRAIGSGNNLSPSFNNNNNNKRSQEKFAYKLYALNIIYTKLQ